MNKHVERIWSAHLAGHFTLPDEVLRARKAFERMEAQRLGARVNENRPKAAEVRAVAEILAAAANDEPLPEVEGDVLEARRADEATLLRAKLYSDAAVTAGEDLVHSVAGNADAIVAGHLRPALEEVVAVATKALTALEGVEINPHIIVTAGTEKQRKAYADLSKAGTRYRALREAQAALLTLTEANPASPAIWGIVSNAEVVAPPRTGFREVDQDPIERLAWLIRSDASPWMPTVAERDAAWRATHKQEEALARRAAG